MKYGILAMQSALGLHLGIYKGSHIHMQVALIQQFLTDLLPTIKLKGHKNIYNFFFYVTIN